MDHNILDSIDDDKVTIHHFGLNKQQPDLWPHGWSHHIDCLVLHLRIGLVSSFHQWRNEDNPRLWNDKCMPQKGTVKFQKNIGKCHAYLVGVSIYVSNKSTTCRIAEYHRQ